jgi:oligopeptidase B
VHETEPASRAGWCYGVTRMPGHPHRVFTRTGPDGREHVLFDEAERAGGHAYYRATGHQHSPDDRWFAWAEDVVGDDRHRICLLDMASGAIRTVVAGDAFGYGGLVFSPTSSHLFWIWRDVHSRPTRLYRTPVDGGPAALVHEEHDPALFMQVARTAAGGFVALTLVGPDMGEVHLIPADAETAPPRLVRPRQRGTRYTVDEWRGELLLLTDADGAVDRKLLALDPASLAVRRELVPHRAGVLIDAVLPFAEALVRLERADASPRLVLMHPDGRETPVSFGDDAAGGACACAVAPMPAQPYAAAQVRVVHQTPASPPRWIDVCLADGTQRVAGQERLRGFDPAAYRVERLHARAADGQQVPITVLSRRDAQGPAPLLLTGYGAYGIASEAGFSWAATALVDAGWRYAIAHVRGGSDKGMRWYREGRGADKRNSMTDFIACAEHLLQSGYAAPGRIVAHGVSAGGLLVCGAMNMAPQLWAGVIAQVPFVDMLNTMSDADHPLVPLLRPDWGDPLADPAAYDHIIAISPCDSVRPAGYPPLLCTAGLKDDRVPYWEPAKLVAHVRAQSTSGCPAVLLLDPDSGHQGSDDLQGEQAHAALLWAFARQCVAAVD